MRPVDVPDECYALVEFSGTGVGSMTLSWNSRRDQHIEIEGERGTLLYDSPSLLQWLEGTGPFDPTVTFASPSASGRRSQLPLPGQEAFASQEQALARMFGDIVSYLRGGAAAPLESGAERRGRGGERADCVGTFADGAAVLSVIDAIVASDQAGAWLDVPA